MNANKYNQPPAGGSGSRNKRQPLTGGSVRKPNNGFNGVNPYRLSISQCLGSEAKQTVQSKFDYLGDNLRFANSSPHTHPYGAWMRYHVDAAVTLGCVPNSKIIDVGAHALRVMTMTEEREVDQQLTDVPVANRVWLTCPIIDGRDVHRHITWNAALAEKGHPPLGKSKQGELGNCECVSNADRICTHFQDYAAIKAIDSVYYDGVLSGIMTELRKKPSRVAYLSFHDFYHTEEVDYPLTDGEGKVHKLFKDGFEQVEMTVNGNPAPYTHKILQTSGGEWIWEDQGDHFLNEVLIELPYGKHRYVLVRMTCLGKYDIAGCPHVPIWSVKNHVQVQQPKKVKLFLENTIKAGKYFGQNAATFVSAVFVNYGPVKLEPCPGRIEFTSGTGWKYGRGTKKLVRLHPELVQEFLQETMGRNEPKDYISAVRKLYRLHIAQKKITTTKTGKTIDYCLLPEDYIDAAKVAWTMSATVIRRLEEFSIEDENVNEARRIQQDKTIPVHWFKRMIKHWFFHRLIRAIIFAIILAGTFRTIVVFGGASEMDPLCHYNIDGDIVCPSNPILSQIALNPLLDGIVHVLKLVTIFIRAQDWISFLLLLATLTLIQSLKSRLRLITFVCYLTVLQVMCPVARAMDTCMDNEQLQSLSPYLLVVALIYGLVVEPWKSSKQNRVERRRLEGTCVTDFSRLDKDKINALSFKVRDPVRDPKNYANGFDYAIANECDVKRHHYATQIGPICMGQRLFTPTVKHSCSLVKMAAAIRATSNQVKPDPKKIAEWKLVMTQMFSELKKAVDEEPIVVDTQKWLKRFPEKYRQDMMKYYWNFKSDGVEKKYRAFPKIEKQFSSIPHEDKDLPENDVKERQICGPHGSKKWALGAICTELETRAQKAWPEYCGNKNWLEIPRFLTKLERRVRDPVWVAADGSGFDMTQHKEIVLWFKHCFIDLLRTADITWPEEVSIEDAIQAMDFSDQPIVQALDGLVEYQVDGTTASGDNFTTLRNTANMISYWRIALKYIPHNSGSGAVVKGDDVLVVIPRSKIELLERGVWEVFCKDKKPQTFGLGQVCKFLEFGDLNQVDFLSAYFVPSGSHTLDTMYRMIRIPKRLFQMTPWTTSIPQNMKGKDLEQRCLDLCFANGLCIQAWAYGLPIFQKYAEMLIRVSGRDPTSWDLKDPTKLFTRMEKEFGVQLEYNEASRYAIDRNFEYGQVDKLDIEQFELFMYQKFGITEDDIRRIESKFDAVTDSLELIEDEIFDLFLDV